MQAIILAAGRGTRMGELTNDLPKPLLKISGRPILEYTLANLPREIDEVILVIGYHGHKIKNLNLTLNGAAFEKVLHQAGESSLIDLEIANTKPVKVLIQEVYTHIPV